MENRSFKGICAVKCDERQNEWLISVSGKEHRIYFDQKKKVGECKFFLDDKEVEIPSTFITKYLWIDHAIQIERRTIRCIYDGKNFDIAVRGRYVDSKKKYYPLSKSAINLVLGIVLIIVELIMIGLQVFSIPYAIGVFVIIFINAAHTDYLVKKAREG